MVFFQWFLFLFIFYGCSNLDKRLETTSVLEVKAPLSTLILGDGIEINTATYRIDAETDQKAYKSVYSLNIEKEMQRFRSQGGVSNLRDGELASLIEYTRHGFQSYADALQGEKALMVKYQSAILATISGLNALPNYEGLVFHGEKTKRSNIVKNFKATSVYRTLRFLSTSKDREVAKEFAQRAQFGDPLVAAAHVAVLFVVKAKRGRSIESLSVARAEQEVLLQPNTPLQVEAVEFEPAGSDAATAQMVIIKLQEN